MDSGAYYIVASILTLIGTVFACFQLWQIKTNRKKQFAQARREKTVEMVHVKELLALTGYVRGGCRPIGMKKQFPTILDSSAEQYDRIYISGGRVGLSLCVAPADILKVSRGSFGQIVR